MLSLLSRPIIIFHTLFRLIGGRAEYSEASDIKKSSVETYDKKQVFDLFLKGAINMLFFVYSRKWSYVG